ncbi:MAG TPA: hypothetical protein VE338_09255 [Ktedonobacterales bacterium]|jgi:hypothetical protein|nr:hypothetical protein [Ktedonobacterales bacterium]
MADITHLVDKAFESKDFSELASAPVDALEGVSKGDAELLQKAFGIKTVRDLGTNKYFLRAQAIAALEKTGAAPVAAPVAATAKAE